MPGKSPYEAVDNYIEPLRRALLCLSNQAHIRLERPHDVGIPGFWILSNEEGLPLNWRHRDAQGRAEVARFFAQQRFSVILADPAKYDPALGKFRVTTTQYSYKLVVDEQELWRMDWHPKRGVRVQPHMHVAPNLGAHVPCGRQTLEDAVEACIEMGAKPAIDGWKQRLDESRDVHRLYREWSNSPDEPRG